MLAASVVFTSVVEFLSIAVYTKGVPVAVHDSLEPRNVRTTGSGDTIFGETEIKQRLKLVVSIGK